MLSFQSKCDNPCNPLWCQFFYFDNLKFYRVYQLYLILFNIGDPVSLLLLLLYQQVISG